MTVQENPVTSQVLQDSSKNDVLYNEAVGSNLVDNIEVPNQIASDKKQVENTKVGRSNEKGVLTSILGILIRDKVYKVGKIQVFQVSEKGKGGSKVLSLVVVVNPNDIQLDLIIMNVHLVQVIVSENKVGTGKKDNDQNVRVEVSRNFDI